MADASTEGAATARSDPVVKADSKSFWPLVFHTLSVVAICLTAFNFYLFYWVWSSLSSADGGRSTVRSGQWAPIDTFSSWDSIKFNGKVTSLKELQAERILARRKEEEEGVMSISGRRSVELSHQKRPLIELVAADGRINFPSGLKVRGGGGASGSARLTCAKPAAAAAAAAPFCLAEAPTISLSHPRGVDCGRKSIQTPRVATKRVHSPTNWLNLFSTNSSSLESAAGSIHLLALDELSLFSHKSAVILQANTIDLSQIRGLNGGRAKRSSASLGNRTRAAKHSRNRKSAANTQYKLCICLSFEATNRAQEDQWNAWNDRRKRTSNREGLVFAVRPQLDCSAFSAFFCNKPPQ